MSGFVAATLAREGFKGAAHPIEGKHGFLRAYAPSPAPERVVCDLDSVWELMLMGMKPYPSCRWADAGIDVAIALRERHGLKASAINSVRLGISRSGMLLVGEPADKKANPANIVDAQFSAPFVIASALSSARMDRDSYRHLNDPEMRSLMQRVHCETDPAKFSGLTEALPGQERSIQLATTILSFERLNSAASLLITPRRLRCEK